MLMITGERAREQEGVDHRQRHQAPREALPFAERFRTMHLRYPRASTVIIGASRSAVKAAGA